MLPTLSPSLYLRIYSSENQKILKMMFLWIFDVHKYVRTKEGTVRDLAQHSESQYPIRYRAEAYRLKIKKKHTCQQSCKLCTLWRRTQILTCSLLARYDMTSWYTCTFNIVCTYKHSTIFQQSRSTKLQNVEKYYV